MAPEHPHRASGAPGEAPGPDIGLDGCRASRKSRVLTPRTADLQSRVGSPTPKNSREKFGGGKGKVIDLTGQRSGWLLVLECLGGSLLLSCRHLRGCTGISRRIRSLTARHTCTFPVVASLIVPLHFPGETITLICRCRLMPLLRLRRSCLGAKSDVNCSENQYPALDLESLHLIPVVDRRDL